MRDEDLIHVLIDRKTLRGRRLLLMVAAWPKVTGPVNRETTLRRWAMLAGVPFTAVRMLAPILLEHGICTPAGGVDDTAAAVVQQAIVEELEPVARRRARPEPGAGQRAAGTNADKS